MANGTERHARARADALREQADAFDADMHERLEELRDADWPHDEKTSPGVIVIDTAKFSAMSADRADSVLYSQAPSQKQGSAWPRRQIDKLPRWAKGTVAVLGAITALIAAIATVMGLIPAIVQALAPVIGK